MVNEELRDAIDRGDEDAVRAILASHPEAGTQEIAWDDGRGGRHCSPPVGYVAVAGFHGRASHDRAGDLTRALLDAGVPVDGPPDTQETPLVTAASYGEPDVVHVLLERGADLVGRGFAAPGGSALAHAVFFGNGNVAEILVAAGAPVTSLAEAIGAGRVDPGAIASATPDERAAALRAAAVCDRPEAVDALLEAGASLGVGEDGATALHWAAWYGKLDACRRLVERGADPHRRDETHNAAPVDWCRFRRDELFVASPGHDAVEAYLSALRSTPSDTL